MEKTSLQKYESDAESEDFKENLKASSREDEGS